MELLRGKPSCAMRRRCCRGWPICTTFWRRGGRALKQQQLAAARCAAGVFLRRRASEGVWGGGEDAAVGRPHASFLVAAKAETEAGIGGGLLCRWRFQAQARG